MLIAAEATLKRGLRKNERLSIGSGVRSSQRDERARRAAATPPKQPRISGLVQPRVRRLDHAVDERDERGDREHRAEDVEARPARDRGSRARAASRPRGRSAATGTLTRKTDFQSNHSSSRPPGSGPRPMPTAAMPAQMPIALPRSSRGKTFVMIDSVAGMISAPPTPISGADARSAGSRCRRTGPRGWRRRRAASPACSARLRPEAVAERAHRQQQAGEHEQIGVDDPLQRRASMRRTPPAGSAARRSGSCCRAR